MGLNRLNRFQRDPWGGETPGTPPLLGGRRGSAEAGPGPWAPGQRVCEETDQRKVRSRASRGPCQRGAGPRRPTLRDSLSTATWELGNGAGGLLGPMEVKS